MSAGTKMLLTDVAGVVFLVLLSLPPAAVDVTVRFVLLSSTNECA